MAERIGRFKPGENLPVFCEEAIAEGRAVMCSGAKTTQGDYKVKLATANISRAEILGVTQRSSGPTTDPATSWTRRVEVQESGVVWIKAQAAITAGKAVYISEKGEVKEGLASEKNVIGVCLNTATEGGWAEVKLS